MTWELASFLIVLGVVLAGFAWYERSRPPARVVALVAALAALAIAGRIAFAAFPNVKPTTDVVIFAGYALGGAPGFAVGALAALVSNFWFGQGPWTPWQMAGWGLCGTLGAALALGRGAEVGRLRLAAACGVAGILYGALMNFSLMATYGGDLSWERFWVLMGRAAPFDIAHALANVAFALLAGPAMIRMLTRFRRRFEWRRAEDAGPRPGAPSARRGAARAGAVAAALACLLLLGGAAPERAAAANAAERGLAFLVAAQNADGGFGASPGDSSGPEMTAWATLGIAAAGRNPLDVRRAGNSPIDYLRRHVGELRTPGDLARTIVALAAAGVSPRDFGGRNLVADLRERRLKNGAYRGRPGSPGWPNSTAFAVLALRAAGADGGVEKTVAWLREVQNEDGGWGDVPGYPSNADTTGIVLQVLSPGSKASSRGLEYLRRSVRTGGGFSINGNGPVNAQSTAWAVEGIRAAGADPGSAAFRRGGETPLDYLRGLQRPDGAFRYSRSSDQTPIWVTGEVLIAVAGKHLPLAAPARAPEPKRKRPSAPSRGISSTGSGASAPAPTLPPAASGSSGAGVSPAKPGGSGAGEGGAAGGLPPGLPGSPGAPDAPGLPAPVPEDPDALPEGAEPGLPTPLPVTGEEAAAEDSKSSPLGAIGLGLLAGALLFGLGWAGRRGWMRWRYGL